MKDLTSGKTFSVLLTFAIPMMIAGIISQSYNLIDLVVAGKFIGSDALSASGCSSTFIQFLSSLFWGFGVAVATVVGELYGEGKNLRIVTVLKTVLIFITAAMLILSGLCFLLAPQIMLLLKVDPDIFISATSYFRIYMCALFVQALSYQITCALQSLGNSRFPMLMTITSGTGNLLLNLLFVIVFHMGVEGLAYATLLSCLISMIMGIVKTIQTIYELGGDLHFEFSFKEFRSILRLAIPCILQQCSLYLASVIVQPIINAMGKAVSAGYSVAMNLNLLFNAIYHSISRSVASYTSQSKGKKLHSNYTKGILIGILQQILLVTPLFIVCEIFPEEIFSVFIQEGDTACLPYAVQYVRLCLPFVFFTALGNLMHSFYKSVESVKTVLFSTIVFTISRVALTYLLPPGEFLFAVYLSLSLAWVIEAAVLIGIYFLGVWKCQEHREYDRLRRKRAESK